jgi:hypothetical protein
MWTPAKNNFHIASEACKYQWEIKNHGDYFSIKNVNYNEYLYCGKNM